MNHLANQPLTSRFEELNPLLEAPGLSRWTFPIEHGGCHSSLLGDRLPEGISWYILERRRVGFFSIFFTS